ncbi:MAG: tandem-95 repeat protein, partial [Gammaproteobacteria bacterium]|nr:tandem-95 repeat protein [Gammaproteobacteria bacterium]
GSADEDNAITGTLTATDTADGFTDSTYFSVTTAASNGTATIDAETGAWSYTPNADYNGVDAFTVTITDDDGHTTTRVISLTVNAVADITVDAITTDEDNVITSNLLSNDNFDGTPVITAITQGTHGTVAIVDANAGTVSYTPDANFNGSDTYTYSVTSGGVTETATVTVTVNAVDDAATISGTDTGSVQEDVLLIANNISTSGTLNIIDVDTGEASFTAETIVGTYGTLNIATNGDWDYTADNTQAAIQALGLTESLTDTITVSSFDGTTHNVVITIHGSDDLAVIGGTTTGSVTEDGTLTSTGTLFITDTDTSAPTDFVDVAITAGVNGYGTFEMTSNSWTYKLDNTNATVQALDTGEILTDNYTFTAPDGVTQLVSITINGAEDTPLFDSTAVTAATEDATYSYSITTSDVDIEVVSITATTLPAWLTLTDHGDGTATLFGIPVDAEVGIHPVVINVNDGTLNSNQSFSITVANSNDTPIAINDTASTVEDTAINNINVLLNDSDIDGDTLSIINASAANGTVTINADSSFNYTPNTDFNGEDSISYTLDDGNGATTSGLVTVTVIPVSDIVNNTIITNEDTAASINVLANDSFGAGAIISSVSQGSNGSVTFINDGTVTYTPNTDYNGTDSFLYTITTAAGDTETGIVNITIKPVSDIISDSISLSTDTASNFNVLQNNRFGPGALINSVTQPTNGQVIVEANGTISYIPDNGFTGNDQFTYSVITAAGDSVTSTFNITIEPKIELPATENIAGTPQPQVNINPSQNIATNPTSLVDESVVQVNIEDPIEVETEELSEETGENLKEQVQSLIKDNSSSKTGTVSNNESGDEAGKTETNNISKISISQTPQQIRDISLSQLQALNDQLSNQAKLSAYLDSEYEFDSDEEARLFQKIDELNHQIHSDKERNSEESHIEAQVVLASSISLTAGFVSWVLRGGSLLASLMSTVPLLNKFDPLPILKNQANKDKAKEKDDIEESGKDESNDEVGDLLKHIKAKDNASKKH